MNNNVNKKRERINKKNQSRLKNKDFSLIASNCNGVCILHDLGLRFNSPFVNLWIKPKDFLKICNNLEHYMSVDLTFTTEEGIDYPVGQLEDVQIYFQHYATEEEAKEKWNERRKRINYDNLFILFSDRDGCTYEDLQTFDNLKYPNKKVFVHKKYPEIKNAAYIPGFESLECCGLCNEFKNDNSGKKYYDSFDYVSWFNGKQKKFFNFF